ncbi:MAG: NAD(P)/FAD-dependent oxidoreductase [Chloroflexi bacterium]|nr:NAD(P)/FAD-dependent oxidoreductase [Chloroflexota bacterium]
MADNIDKVKYLIIGNSAGGIGAAEAIREVDKTGSIAIVSDEPYPAYSRPLISKYLAEKCSLERMLYRPADFYEKNNIKALLGRKIARLDVDAHLVEMADGEKLGWQKLLVSTGGLPIIPPTKGIKSEGVFSFLTLDDAKAIDQYLKHASRVVVIGGGLIGVSVTEGLVKRGVDITIIEMKERILNVMLDEEASAMADKAVRKAGVKIVTNHTVAEISGEGGVSSVTLNDGTAIPCDMVVVAIGVVPRVELASGKLKTNRGIVVDRFMATSSPDVYACGDVAEAYDFIYGMNRVTPVWPNAYMGGRVAGFNMAGVSTEYRGGTAMNSLSYFGLDVASAGMVMPLDAGYEVLSARYGNIYRKVLLKDGFVVGMVFVGETEKSGIAYNLMKDQVKVDGFKKALIAREFGLASLPDELWRPRIEAPRREFVPPVAVKEPGEEVAVE